MKRAPSKPQGNRYHGPEPAADAADSSAGHVPVLLDAVLAALMPCDGAVYVDGTFGAGGYSAALLAAAQCRGLGIDCDPESVRRGAALASRHARGGTPVEGGFRDHETPVGAGGPRPLPGVALRSRRALAPP